MMMTTEDVTAAATASPTPKPAAEPPRRRANGRRRAVGGLALALIMGVGGTLLLWGSTFTTTMVRDQLVAQKIRFPAKGSEALKPAEYPGLQRYAGQLVDDGPKAKAYAEQFIGKHLKAIAGGKTYSEVRTASRANPSDQTLAGQSRAMFEGETTRGLLLSAWGWSVIGRITGLAALGAFALAALALVVTAASWVRSRTATARAGGTVSRRTSMPALAG